MTSSTICKLSGAYWIKPSRQEYERQGLSPDQKENRFVYYQLQFQLDEAAKLELSISANSRYRLWINGSPILSGPCKGDRWRHYYETLDVSEHLCIGENKIAVQVWSLNSYMVNDPLQAEQPLYAIASLPVGPQLAISGRCVSASSATLVDITTGVADWRAWVDEAITIQSDPQYTIYLGAIAETVYAERLPHDWKGKASIEQGNESVGQRWLQAEKGAPCLGIHDRLPSYIVPQLPLVERPIPLLYEKQKTFVREMPIRKQDLEPLHLLNLQGENDWIEIPAHRHVVVELDAGELTTGYVVYHFAQGKGAKVTFRYAERYFQPGQENTNIVRDDSINGVIMGLEDVYYPSGKKELYEPFWFRTFRFIRIEIETANEPLLIQCPTYRESAYPLEPRSVVRSTESWVEPLWSISLRTLQFCMHETYEDCPYYEQMQFIMDTRLQALFTYSVGGDIELARKALEDFHSSMLPEGITQNRYPSSMVQVIPSFSLHYIFMLFDFYWQTGDAQLIRRYRPTVDAILDWFDRKIGASGLVENIGYWEYIDWVTEWEGGEPTAGKHGPSTVHNLVYAAALQVGAEINRSTARDQVAQEYDQRAKCILSTIEQSCWSEEQGMYREGPSFEQYSQHAQLWAVLTGLCEGEKTRRVLTHALDNPDVLKCSFSMAFFLFRALERAGMYQRTRALITQWTDLFRLNLTTLPETPEEPRSDCHAWSALPLYEMIHCMLGIKSTKPGWKEILIEPQLLDLPDLQGEFHSPVGIISVTCKQSESSYEIYGSVPNGIPFRVKLGNSLDRFYEHGGVFSEKIAKSQMSSNC